MPADYATISAITVRLPAPVLRTAKRLAARRRLSLNALVRLAVEQELLRASYDALGSDRDEADVERYWPAQRQAVRRG